MKINEEKEYRGYVLRKKQKNHIQGWKDGILVCYGTTEKVVKALVDKHIAEEVEEKKINNPYMKRIKARQDYNDYHIKENEEYLKKLTDRFKRNVAKCNYPSSLVNICKQFIHDYEVCELNERQYDAITNTLIGMELDFEKIMMEGK